MDQNIELGNDHQKIETISQFLLAEYQSLHERANHCEQLAENRSQIHLAVVTAIVTALLLIYNAEDLRPWFYIIAPFLSFIWLTNGLGTLLQVGNHQEAATIFRRRMGRIRRWYQNLDPSIASFLPFPAVDDQPVFFRREASLHSIDITLVVSTVIAAIFWVVFMVLAMLPSLIFGKTGIEPSDTFKNLAGWFVLALLFFWGIKYLQRLFKKSYIDKDKREIEQGQIHFPTLVSNETKPNSDALIKRANPSPGLASETAQKAIRDNNLIDHL